MLDFVTTKEPNVIHVLHTLKEVDKGGTRGLITDTALHPTSHITLLTPGLASNALYSFGFVGMIGLENMALELPKTPLLAMLDFAVQQGLDWQRPLGWPPPCLVLYSESPGDSNIECALMQETWSLLVQYR